MTLDAVSAAISAAGTVSADLVIVDNGSTDDTWAVLTAWRRTARVAMTMIKEPRRGLAIARNTGMNAATGRILAFTDDDCCPAPTYVAELLRHYAADTGPVIRGGRVELGDPRDLPFTIKLDDQTRHLVDGIHPGAFVLGCNMTMHRAVVERLGGFDERFGAGATFRAAEETDLLYRAYKSGIPVEYVPDMTVRHFHGRRDMGDIKRLNHGYHVGSGALYAKYGLSDPALLRHFYWASRDAVMELFGGRRYDPQLGLSHFTMVLGNVRGFLLYLLQRKPSAGPPSPVAKPAHSPQRQPYTPALPPG